jgi:hypothetical protein
MVNFIGSSKQEFLSEHFELFRYTSIDRFLELLSDDSLIFLNPSTWSDPYERYYIEKKYYVSKVPETLPIKESAFCLCLSGTKSSEALWKVYAPKEDGVRLTFKVSKLVSALDKVIDCDFYIGKVDYQTTSEFSRLKINHGDLLQDIRNNRIGEQQLKLILKKRIAFDYENEIRIIAIPKRMPPKKTPKDTMIYKSKVGIKSFTTEYLFDPRLGKFHFKLLKDFLRKTHGLKISHSVLYKVPIFSPVVLG